MDGGLKSTRYLCYNQVYSSNGEKGYAKLQLWPVNFKSGLGYGFQGKRFDQAIVLYIGNCIRVAA